MHILSGSKAFDHKKPILLFSKEELRSPVRSLLTRTASKLKMLRVPETEMAFACADPFSTKLASNHNQVFVNLFLGFGAIWDFSRDSSEMKLFQSQVFVYSVQACRLGNPEVLNKKFTRQKRTFFEH
jgi:hypothetical protein